MSDDSNAKPATLTVLILAGGSSRRFGADKAVATRPDGVRFLDAVINAVTAATAGSSTTIFALGEPRPCIEPDADLQWWPEPEAGGGPLAAVSQWVDSQEELAADGYLLIACDYPFADAATVGGLLSLGEAADWAFDVYMPRVEGYDHPLFAWYSRAGVERLAASEAGGSMMGAIRELAKVRLVVPRAHARPYRNVNRPEELSFAE